MKTYILALTLAMSMALLAACGGGSASSAPGSQDGDGSGASVSAPGQTGDASEPDHSQPGASLPEQPDASASGQAGGGAGPDGSASSEPQPSVEPEEPQPQVEADLSLSRSDFTLSREGASWQLKAKATPAGGRQTWTSSDPAVATVSDNGTVTAVARGTAVITVTDEGTGLTAECIVRCSWQDPAPEQGGSSAGDSSTGGSSAGDSSTGDSSAPEQGGDSSSGGEAAGSSQVDLKAFFDTINTEYEMPFMMEMDSAALDSYFPGLTGISTQQLVAYFCGLSPSPAGDVVLVQVTDSADVEAVKALFQARIDYMTGADGGQPGAWYPGPTEMWLNSSRIVSNGSYVMLVVNDNCEAIVSAFNALF